MKRMSLLIVMCFVLTAVFSNAAVAAEKVGYINLQRLVNESKMGQSARQEILKLRKEKERTVAGKLNEINRLKESINDKNKKLSAVERRDKLEALQKK